ncbi:hypothetical protein Agabi119p4_8066 [Agaricus bisporus var. burnettii]|uniref:Uncharacterized protein n=1 Tax=Agaricus bisporus var. burnettii TaxID=192524 RepID=A0A8H7EYN3_AGABI|nr:hypothetical protein Agabi119p4_8066 [Agaricus bisporus var. burnettii]
MGSSSSSSSSFQYPSSSYRSQSYSVPGSFDQPRQNRQQDQAYQEEESSSSRRMNQSGSKVAPPIYQRDYQPQRQQQQRQAEVVNEQPPGYSGTAPMAYPYYGYGRDLCRNGQHDYRTEYGLAGILCAIFCFPCGLLGLW